MSSSLDAVPARPTLGMVAAAAVAFVVPASTWWVYTTYARTALALPRLGSGQHYTYVHVPLGAALLFLGWALGQTLNQITKSSSTAALAADRPCRVDRSLDSLRADPGVGRAAVGVSAAAAHDSMP